jgi:hypothetical protein
LQTGRMLNYLFCSSDLNDKVKTIFEEQSQKSFSTWIAERRRRREVLILIGLPLIVIATTYLVLTYRFKLRDFRDDICFGHILLLGLMICYIRKRWLADQCYHCDGTKDQVFIPKDQCKRLLKASKDHLKKLKRHFQYFWGAMLALYILLAFWREPALSWVGNHVLGDNLLWLARQWLLFAANNLGLLALFCCFVVLSLPSHRSASEKYQDESSKRWTLVVNYARLAVLILIASFPLLLFSIFAYDPDTLRDYSAVFDAISGTLNAVVLALLIARLSSKLFHLSVWLISILFLYSAIQPFFVLFPLKNDFLQSMLTFMLCFVFVLKIFFFLVVAYVFESKRVLSYLLRLPFLNTAVNSIFDNQFEIKIHKDGKHSFSFSITRKGLLVYFSDWHSSTREDCDREVDALRDLMKESSRYKPDETCGTRWIKVRDSNDRIICQSISLRSTEEVDDLIEESVEKIPYCKYNRG